MLKVSRTKFSHGAVHYTPEPKSIESALNKALCNDIILKICQFLFLKDVFAMMRVCKRFRDVIGKANVRASRCTALMTESQTEKAWNCNIWDTQNIEHIVSMTTYMICENHYNIFKECIMHTRYLTHLTFGFLSGHPSNLTVNLVEFPATLLHLEVHAGNIPVPFVGLEGFKARNLKTFCVYGNSKWGTDNLNLDFSEFKKLTKLHFYAASVRYSTEFRIPLCLEKFHFSIPTTSNPLPYITEANWKSLKEYRLRTQCHDVTSHLAVRFMDNMQILQIPSRCTPDFSNLKKERAFKIITSEDGTELSFWFTK